MARSGWDNLSTNYRGRLERSGITREAYETGTPLRQARGHAQTPEHPGQGLQRPEFQTYYQRRRPEVIDAYRPTPGAHSDEVKQAIAQRINEIFGNRHKYHGVSLDPDYPPLGLPPAPSDEEIMEILELDDYELEEYASYPEYWFLWYH